MPYKVELIPEVRLFNIWKCAYIIHQIISSKDPILSIDSLKGFSLIHSVKIIKSQEKISKSYMKKT